jgi:hypothetical protein
MSFSKKKKKKGQEGKIGPFWGLVTVGVENIRKG